MNLPIFTSKDFDIICKALSWYADEQNSFPANLLFHRIMAGGKIELSLSDALVVQEALKYLDKRLPEIFSAKEYNSKKVQATRSCIHSALKTLGGLSHI